MELSVPIPFDKRTTLRIPLVTAIVDAGFPSPADAAFVAFDVEESLCWLSEMR